MDDEYIGNEIDKSESSDDKKIIKGLIEEKENSSDKEIGKATKAEKNFEEMIQHEMNMTRILFHLEKRKTKMKLITKVQTQTIKSVIQKKKNTTQSRLKEILLKNMKQTKEP